MYQFENLMATVDTVEILNLTREFPNSRKLYRLAKSLSKSENFSNSIASFSPQIKLDRDYDILFVVLDNPWQTYLLNGIEKWRDRCRFVACYIIEIWEKDLDNWQLLQGPFENFDHIFVGHNHPIEALSRRVNRPCSYLPPAVDTLLFSPPSLQSRRNLDVCYVGRRSENVHRRLLELTNERDFFYYYDTASRQQLFVDDPIAHRSLLANLFKRSRYSIVHYAKFNRPEETGYKQEIGYRFFEGAAAGTVMIGVPPETEIYRQLFDWPNAVVEADVNTCDIAAVIAELDAQPELLAQIRRDNISNALRRHDWLHRWQQVLATFDLPQTPEMEARDRQLKQRAQHLLDPQAMPEVATDSASFN